MWRKEAMVDFSKKIKLPENLPSVAAAIACINEILVLIEPLIEIEHFVKLWLGARPIVVYPAFDMTSGIVGPATADFIVAWY